MAVSGVATCKASSLRPTYYFFGYPMMYTSEEEEKRRVRRGKGKETEGKAWAYGEGWPWTTSSIARATHLPPAGSHP
jgi:hypothetical protein